MRVKLVNVQKTISNRYLIFKDEEKGTNIQVSVFNDSEGIDFWSSLKEGEEYDLALTRTEEKEVENEQPQD